MQIGDRFPYTFEGGEEITYELCSVEDLHTWLEGAHARRDLVGSFDDPFRRVVGWHVGPEGRGVTIMELRDKRGAGVVDDWWWDRVATPGGRQEIAEHYSLRSS